MRDGFRGLEHSAYRESSWAEHLAASLNEAQHHFATSTAPAILGLAGPGSGKTRALVYRAANLIHTGTAPEEVLLLTFTNKAAGEMKDRLQALLGFLPHRLWAGTFHSVGARILRRHAAMAGRTAGFTIIDEDDSSSLLKRILKNMSVEEEDYKVLTKRGFLGRVISQARNAGETLAEVVEEDYPYRLAYLPILAAAAENYARWKKDSNLFDFDDLLHCWLELFENHPHVAAQYSQRFRHILVDEYQDTNIIQGRLVDQFRGEASICVVGDDAQSIYAFRYAAVANILNFPERHGHCTMVRMEKNYRSTPEIVALANCCISHNREQFPKKLYSENPSGPLPVVALQRDAKKEASFVIRCLAELQEHDVPLKEVAVLYRSSYLSPEVEFALARHGIPYRTYGGVKFFQKAHVKDLLSYLKIVYNPADESAWRRVFLLQKGLGEATFERLWPRLRAEGDPLGSALQGKVAPPRGREGWDSLCQALALLTGANPTDSLPSLLESLVEEHYAAILRRDYPDQFAERLSGLESLTAYAHNFSTMAELLESLALEESVFAGTASGSSGGERGDFLTLSTIHSAKGKEWDAVMVIGLNQGHFPSFQALGGNLDEERRLFYVAITRARRYLYLLSYLEDFRAYGAQSEGPSSFLGELPPDAYHLLNRGGGY